MLISINNRGGSSVGRATGLHPVGRRFDSYSLHQKNKARVIVGLKKSRLASGHTVSVHYTIRYLCKLLALPVPRATENLNPYSAYGDATNLISWPYAFAG